MTQRHISIMQHAIGMDNSEPLDGTFNAYRNYYVTGKDPDNSWEELVCEGYAERRLWLGEFMYSLTPKGFKAVANNTGLLIKYTMEFTPEKK